MPTTPPPTDQRATRPRAAPGARVLPIALAAFLGLSLAAVASVRLAGIDPVTVPLAAAVDRIDLRFEDKPDGGIAIIAAATGLAVATVEPGTNGFLRGTMRGLARERRRQGHGPEIPFTLVGRADGRLTLDDPATGRLVDLGSFGPVNAAVFARLLAVPKTGTGPHADRPHTTVPQTTLTTAAASPGVRQ